MSDSEDDKPLAARAAPVHKQAPAANGSAAGSTGEDTTKRKAAQKAPIIDDSDSEDDQPLGARAKAAATKPAPRPRSAETAANKKKAGPVAAKPAAVKDEPLSSAAVKTEPHTSGQKKQSNKSTSKDAADVKQKRVIVKKEYDMPGQTKDTPLEIEPVYKFYTSLREQRPESDMAKKWCLIHGLLERDEAEDYLDEIKRKKGDLRSPGKASNGTAGARKRAAPSSSRPAAARPASSKPPARQKAKIESDSEEDEDDFLPQRKLQKKPSGPRAAGEQQPPRARPASGGSGATTASGDRPAAKPRPTQKDKAFADGGLDPISDDSEDDVPLGRRMTKAV